MTGCAGSSETGAGRDLADTVKIQGYRELYTEHQAETTLTYFVGPAGVDLKQAVSAKGWSPEPPDSSLPDTGAYKRVAEGYASNDKHRCRVVVSTLRPGFEASTMKLSKD